MKKIGLLVSLLFVLCVVIVNAAYIDEYQEAYTWAYNNGITTMTTMNKANMYGEITRIEFSKMISNYTINILKKKPDTSKKCEFSDISDSLNTQYDNGVTNACQLGLMGQGITKFRPKDKVTRAEFGTILSRLLYGNKYDGGTPYYKKHLNQLNIRGIMTNMTNAKNVKESRGNVMVMLKRSETLGNKVPSFEEINDIINDKCPSDFEGYYDTVYKKGFIRPYKDGYIGYEFGGQDWWGFYITYRKLNDPCSTVLISDEIFTWNPYYTVNQNEEPGNNSIYYSKRKEIAKDLNCKTGDYNNCKKEAEKFFYNLVIGSEYNEYFSFWMNAFKKNIDNNYKNEDRSNKFYDCINKFKIGGNVQNIPITDEEIEVYEKWRCNINKAEHYCAYEYIGACFNGNYCEKLKSEINDCKNLKIKGKTPNTDERFPGYNVIYGGTGTSYQSIVGDKVVYYNDNVGISLKLKKEFSGGLIYDDNRELRNHKHHIIYFFKKDPNARSEELGRGGYKLIFQIKVIDDSEYDSFLSSHDETEALAIEVLSQFADGFENNSSNLNGGWNSANDYNIIGKNNKYFFVEQIWNSLDGYSDLDLFESNLNRQDIYSDLRIFNIN